MRKTPRPLSYIRDTAKQTQVRLSIRLWKDLDKELARLTDIYGRKVTKRALLEMAVSDFLDTLVDEEFIRRLERKVG